MQLHVLHQSLSWKLLTFFLLLEGNDPSKYCLVDLGRSNYPALERKAHCVRPHVRNVLRAFDDCLDLFPQRLRSDFLKVFVEIGYEVGFGKFSSADGGVIVIELYGNEKVR